MIVFCNSALLFLLALLFMPGRTMAAEDCLSCHRQATPAAVKQWEASRHFGSGIGCEACHDTKHDSSEYQPVPVDSKVCGACHPLAYHQHLQSRHGLALKAGWACTRNRPRRDPAECRFCHEEATTKTVSKVQCARFLMQTTEMTEAGCNRCHQVENSCASCHTSHDTDLEIVRRPEICAKCHMGPDHPQWEMWQTSAHGTLFYAKGEELGPTCQTCHMPAGTHDVSTGITATPGVKILPAGRFEAERAAMVKICRRCHTERLVNNELDRGDAIRAQSLELLAEAREIIADLNDRALLAPGPEQRPPHPLQGNKLVLDGEMLYENISHIERLFFKMMKYDLAKTVKGAFHQNPAYTHWYGNAELKMDLVDIKSEALRLQERNAPAAIDAKPAVTRKTAVADLEAQLKILKNKFDRGALAAREYEQERKRLLEILLNQ